MAPANDWFDRAVRHREAGRIEDSIDAYRRAIAEQPELACAHEQLAKLLYREGRGDEAAEVYRRWHRIDPRHPVAAHLLAATGGAPVPDRAPDAFVVDLFDRAAPDFDTTLETLGYRAPELLLERISDVMGEASAALTVLDLGCGTGLCGSLVRPWARRLVGVDLSLAMLQRAGTRNVYDDLHAAEVTEFLRSSERSSFDLILAADVFCYFGDLAPVLAAAAGVLRPAGHLFFSVEDLESPAGFDLRPHGRYAHSAAYLQLVLSQARLTATLKPDYMLRFERGAPVAGLIVDAALNSAAS